MKKYHRIKGKHFKEIKKKIKLIIFILTIIILLSIAYIIKDYVDKEKLKETSDLLNSIEIEENRIAENIDISEPTKTERMLQVEKLQEQNEDIVGWIEIVGTNINYPVLQGDDNTYYMTHDYKKNKNTYGSIFLDKDYDWNIPSSNLLIYGHNLQDGTMFHDILNYKDKNYYEEHSIIRFTTAEEDCEYDIISAFYSRVYYKSEKNVFRYYYFINAETEDEYNEFIENAKKSSIYDTGKDAEYGEQLITLSTCSYHTEDGRFAIVARKNKN